MRNFIVVETFLDYDYLEDVKYICDFDSQQEAKEYIENIKTVEQQKTVKFLEYVDTYADNFTIPEKFLSWNSETYIEWELYKKNFCLSYGIMPHQFNQNLKSSLRSGNKIKNDDFNPPLRGLNRDLWIISKEY